MKYLTGITFLFSLFLLQSFSLNAMDRDKEDIEDKILNQLDHGIDPRLRVYP